MKLLALATALATAAASAAGAAVVPIGFERVGTTSLDPIGIAAAGDGSGRLFLVLKPGVIEIFDGAQVLPTPFLDIRARVGDGGSEQGLLGLAFHPDYAANGHFYVNYTDNAGDTVVSRFSVTADPDIADPGSELRVLGFDQPFSNHNGGQLAFGPDGYLYIATGDGGSGGDPMGNGQSLNTLLGKLLRVDVAGDDFPADPARNYAVPPDNPFVGAAGLDEIWDYGLRNPWRFTFDRRTGDVLIGDVGQNLREEIDFEPAAGPGGGNYGWNRMEGSLCFEPPTDCNDGTLVLPILEYDHFDGGFVGCAVIGGYRYRGRRNPMLDGIYFYGDNCTGAIWGGVEIGGIWNATDPLDTSFNITSFGEDDSGEVYFADQAGNGIYRIFDVRPFCDVETSQTVYTNGETITLSTARLVNRGDAAAAVRVQLTATTPGGELPLLDLPNVTLPAGSDLDAGPRPLVTVTPGTPRGEYAIHCRLLDPASGALRASDSAAFTVE